MRVLLALFLTSCSGFTGGREPYGVFGVGSHRRHNVSPIVGGGVRWDGGADLRATWEPQLRVEEPSTRGEPEELMAFRVEMEVPVR